MLHLLRNLDPALHLRIVFEIHEAPKQLLRRPSPRAIYERGGKEVGVVQVRLEGRSRGVQVAPIETPSVLARNFEVVLEDLEEEFGREVRRGGDARDGDELVVGSVEGDG